MKERLETQTSPTPQSEFQSPISQDFNYNTSGEDTKRKLLAFFTAAHIAELTLMGLDTEEVFQIHQVVVSKDQPEEE